MSTRRVAADSSFSLPANPSYLDFTKSDGNVSTWPENTVRIVDSEGHVNFYEYLNDEHGVSIRWRTMIGDAVARKREMPEGVNYVLRSFPDKYRFFDHHKGPATNPRHDVYLFGPLRKKFRSVNEFIPHAIWLMGDLSMDCECKYCARRSQKEVTASMTLSNIIRSSPTQSPTPPKVRVRQDKGKARELNRPIQRDTNVYASVQRVPKPLKPTAGVLKQPMLVERSNDLRAIYSKTSMELRRWFREGEVVWCALDPPILGIAGENAVIEFWPGVVDEIKLKTEPVPRAGGSTNKNSSSSSLPQDQPEGSSSSNHDASSDPGGRGPVLEPSKEPLPWLIRQSTKYKVQLLGVSVSYTIPDDGVVPYQAYVPSDDLIKGMIAFPPSNLNFDREALSKFNPCPGEIPPTFFEAVPAFAYALQIASVLSSTWCLTDEFQFKYSIQSPNTSPKAPMQPLVQPPLSQPTTLQSAIENAGRYNSELSKSVSYYRNSTGINPDMTSGEVQKTTNRILGVPPAPDQLLQTSFQGLWWGSERIWTDDFIRLKVPRRTLAPNGGPNILAPSGPGKSIAEQWSETGKDPAELGAATRGVFLRLDGLFTVDVPNGSGGMKKEARVRGMLYELADEDWEDPTESKPVVSPGQDPSSAGAASSSIGPGISTVLPQAPIGFKFRPIICKGYEFVGAMGLISGRYYPKILTHPKIKPRVVAALSRSVEDGGVTGFDNLWALEGLSGGYFNSVDPHRYKKSRLTMVQDADKEALMQLQTYVETKVEEQQGDLEVNHNAMEVDDS